MRKNDHGRHSTRRTLAAPWALAAALAALLVALPAAAQQAVPLFGNLAEEGWSELEKGVWQRPTNDGTTQIRADGVEGLVFGLDHLRAQQTTLVEIFLDNPSEKNLETLRNHSEFIAELELGLAKLQAAEKASPDLLEIPPDGLIPVLPPPQPFCQYDFYVGALASPGLGCGAFSNARADYSTTCSDACTVYSYSYTSHTCGTTTNTTTQSCLDNGTDVECASVTSAYKSDSGYTNSNTYAFCPTLGFLYLSDSDSYSYSTTSAWCQC